MKKLRIWARSYPIISGLIVLAISTFALNPLDWFVGKMPGVIPNADVGNFLYIAYDSYLIPFLLAALLGLLWIYRQGSFARTMKVGAAELLLALFIFSGSVYYALKDTATVWKQPGLLVLGMFEVFGIGFLEETIHRGIIANLIGRKYGKDAKGVWLAAILSGSIFGFGHMINMAYGVSVQSALIQSIVGCGAGILYAAIYYRGGSIWALILIHVMTDAGSLFNSLFTVTEETSAETINALDAGNLVPLFLSLGLALFLLRRSRISEAVETLNNDSDQANY